MHVAHDKNVLCDSYIINFVHDDTESYYERGKHGFMHLNNIKFPLDVESLEVALVLLSYACCFVLP